MDIQDYDKFYHADISTQIDNKWKEDTVLGIVRDSRRYSIKIRAINKEELKRRFIVLGDSRSNKKHNKKVVVIIYSFLLYNALCDFPEANPLLLCRDVRPERLVIHYLQKISNFYNNKRVLDRVIKFRKRSEFESSEKLPKSLAGMYTRKVFQGKIEVTRVLEKKEVEDVIEIISKII
jgi:hypothetical protein